jgi:hypothetical protein
MVLFGVDVHGLLIAGRHLHNSVLNLDTTVSESSRSKRRIQRRKQCYEMTVAKPYLHPVLRSGGLCVPPLGLRRVHGRVILGLELAGIAIGHVGVVVPVL